MKQKRQCNEKDSKRCCVVCLFRSDVILTVQTNLMCLRFSSLYHRKQSFSMVPLSFHVIHRPRSPLNFLFLSPWPGYQESELPMALELSCFFDVFNSSVNLFVYLFVSASFRKSFLQLTAFLCPTLVALAPTYLTPASETMPSSSQGVARGSTKKKLPHRTSWATADSKTSQNETKFTTTTTTDTGMGSEQL